MTVRTKLKQSWSEKLASLDRGLAIRCVIGGMRNVGSRTK